MTVQVFRLRGKKIEKAVFVGQYQVKNEFEALDKARIANPKGKLIAKEVK